MNERDIFLAALELTSNERSVYLDLACQGNQDLRDRVELLLLAHLQSGDLIDQLAAAADEQYARGQDSIRNASVHTEDLDFLEPGRAADCLGSLGSYDVIDVIGRGGAGIVLKSRDRKLDRIVAIKVLAPAIASDGSARDRFLREARSVAAVCHDNVVSIYAVDEINGLPFTVMEYVVGQSLQQKIEETGPLELKQILRIAIQIAEALGAAHEQGIVHRDIKPGNILLRNGIERVKVTDFGLARAADDSDITQQGQILGTPLYMSPEQAQGDTVNSRSDLFSLGSVCYAMCTGQSAFRAKTFLAVMRRVCEEQPIPIQELNPEIPDWLVTAIGRMMSKKPSDRFAEASEVADLFRHRLAELQDPNSTSPENATRPKSASLVGAAKWTLMLTGATLLASVLIVTWQQFFVARIRDVDHPQTLTQLPAQRPDPSTTVSKARADSGAADDGSLRVRMAEMPAPVSIGKWHVDGADITSDESEAGVRQLVFGDPEWKDYDLTVEVFHDNVVDIERSILLLADENGDNYWRLDLGAFSDPKNFDLVPILTTVNPWDNPSRRWLAGRLHGLNAWYRVNVEVRDSTVRVSVDGVFITATSENHLRKGRVGIRTNDRGPAHWRNCEVKRPDGTILWTGWPSLPSPQIPK